MSTDDIKDADAKPPADARLDGSGEFLLRSVRWGLLANATLLLGHIFALWFGVYEFTGRARQSTAVFAYYLGFALLIASGLVELSLDVRGIRARGHGRYYCAGTRQRVILSCLFVAAGILDIVAFVYWTRREEDAENLILLVSAYFLIVMAILTLYWQRNELREKAWTDVILAEKIDLAANCIVLAATILTLAFRHMDESGRDFGDATDEMEMATFPIWEFSSMLYVASDVITYKKTMDGSIDDLDEHF